MRMSWLGWRSLVIFCHEALASVSGLAQATLPTTAYVAAECLLFLCAFNQRLIYPEGSNAPSFEFNCYGQATLPTNMYVAAGWPLSLCPLTNVWSTRRGERSKF